MPKNLWGKLPSADNIRLPIIILKEQATALSEMTNGVLSGEVDTGRSGDSIVVYLNIVAPALDAYKYLTAVARHRIDGYPATLIPGWNWVTEKDAMQCATAEEFEAGLATLLSSAKVHSVIQALIAQSRA